MNIKRYKFVELDAPIVFKFPNWDANLLAAGWIENWIYSLYINHNGDGVWKKIVPGKIAIALAEIETWYVHDVEKNWRCSHSIVFFENKYWIAPYTDIKSVKAAEI